MHIAIDDHTRLAYVEELPDESPATTAAFLRRAYRRRVAHPRGYGAGAEWTVDLGTQFCERCGRDRDTVASARGTYRDCPSCGAAGTMRKQFAAPAIHFKGSGWAKKDRGSSSSTKT